MKQFWLFVLNSIQNIVFCAVDLAFANNISIDAIVVLGSYTVIETLGMVFLNLGRFAYQSLQKNEHNCCVASLFSGIIIGILVITLSTPITYIFELTTIQQNMLKNLLIIYGLSCPMESVARFLQTYITYNCYNKLRLWANFGTYILLIFSDWLAIKLGFELSGIVFSTELSWFIYLIVVWLVCKFHKTDDKINVKTILKCIWIGKDVLFSRIISRIANVALGHFASTMGTNNYAIHSVALSITSLTEEFRDAVADFTLIKLKDDSNKNCKPIIKQLWLPFIMCSLVSNIILTIFMHGEVPILEAYYGVVIYSIPYLIYPIYDVLQSTILLSNIRQKAVLTNGLICALWRIPIIWVISLLIPISIPILGTIYLGDYLTRTISYNKNLKNN